MKLPESARSAMDIAGRVVIIVLAIVGAHEVERQIAEYFGYSLPGVSYIDIVVGAAMVYWEWRRERR